MCSLKTKLVLCSFTALCVLSFAAPEKTFAQVYVSDGVVYSTNLIPIEATTTSYVNSLTYSASAIPAGTTLRLQITTDDANAASQNWYNADGVINEWETLSVGTTTLDLQALAWNKKAFYYRVWFTSDGTATPVLDSVSLTYSSGATTYPLGGSFTSNNLLFTNSTAAITGISYNASSIPSGSSMKIQYSYDNLNWYNSSGVLKGRDTLVEGVNSINLTSLGWTKSAFYYRVWLTSDGDHTPVLDSVSLQFDLGVGVYETYGIVTSKNLLSGSSGAWVTSLSYTASSIPAGASLRMQITTDDENAESQNWYNSEGRINEWEVLSVGTNTFDLQSFGGNKRTFYYRVWLTSDGTVTPVLDSVSLTYSSGDTTYPLGGLVTSNNLIPSNSTAVINSLSYTASSIPVGSAMKIQFSYDNLDWYDFHGIKGARTSLSEGTNIIDLSSLAWTKSAFYYRVWLTSDGTVTPILDSVNLSFDLQNESAYSVYGMVTSKNLVTDSGNVWINSLTYSASAIPAGTTLRLQITTDDANAASQNWYNADGVINEWETLSVGTTTIDLQALAWNKKAFYYRVWFTSDGTATPVLDSVSLTYSSGATTYPLGGSFTSNNLLFTNSTAAITGISYNASSIPSGSSMKIQYSYDNLNWYNSSGVLKGRDTLVEGVNSINLTSLGWTKSAFYYRVWLTSDGDHTPVLDSVSLQFDLVRGSSGYETTGLVTSKNLVPDVYGFAISKVDYIASSIPTSTSMRIQFSTDGYNWYNASSTYDAYTNLSQGKNSIDIPALSWMMSGFYYRVWFISDGSATPVLDYVGVSAAVTNLVVGTYETSGTLLSNNLIPTDIFSTINSFEYNISVLPASTSVSIQFNRGGGNWYNSLGVLNAASALSLGTTTIDLSGLHWEDSTEFYYRLALSSNGSSTPIINSVSLNYSPVSSVTPALTITHVGRQIATTTATISNQNLGGAFKFEAEDGDVTINSIKLHQTGSFSTGNIKNVRLYYKQENTCSSVKPESGTTLFGTLSLPFVAGAATSTANSPLTITVGSTTCMYIVYDLDGESNISTIGRTIDFEITNPVSDVIVAEGGTVGTNSRVNILGQTMIYAEEQKFVTTPTTPNASCSNSIIKSMISIHMNEPENDPTLYYLQNCAIWKKEGEREPVRRTNPNLQVHSLIFQDTSSDSRPGSSVRISITMSNMDPGLDGTFMNVTKTMTASGFVNAWQGGE